MTAREKRIIAAHKRDMIAGRVLMIGLVVEELNRRPRPLHPAEITHFHQLVIRAVDHIIQML